MFKKIKSTAAFAGAALSLALLSACSGPGSSEVGVATSDGSRVTLYESVGDMATDSTTAVTGTVQDQQVRSDIPGAGEFTVSTFVVDDVVKAAAGVVPGQSLVVRQIGSAASPGPAPLIVTGKTYLLYLSSSGLDGDLASQYYVTGGDAGLYQEAEGADGSSEADAFSKITGDHSEGSGDVLPGQLSLDDARTTAQN
jgi:hypothetical protein